MLLLGNPVDDGQHHKGLGMILSSRHSEDTEKLKDTASTENENQKPDEPYHSDAKTNPDLAASLQKSSTGFSSDRDYSYTEALFTGTPLFNGKPFRESDKAHSGHIHGNDPAIDELAKENQKNSESYNSAGQAEPSVDNGNEHNKGEGSVKTQKEIHTEEGVTGITVNNNPKEGQYLEGRVHEANSFSETPENATENLEHQYSPTLDESQFKSKDETLENKEENHQPHIPEGPLQTDAQQGVNSVPSHMITNRPPLKTAIKSYDEESHLIGSRFSNHGNLAHQGVDQGLEQRQHESNENIVTGPTEYGKTDHLQTDGSQEKPNEDIQSNRIESNEKDTNFVSQEGSGGTLTSNLDNENISHESKGIFISPRKEARNRETGIAYAVAGRVPAKQNQEQSLALDGKGTTYDAETIPNRNSNVSTRLPLASATSSKGDRNMESFINQLRPHKIIESSFDEELTQRIVTGPSSGQDRQDLSKQANQKPLSDTFHPDERPLQSSSSYQEGSNPSDFNKEFTKEQGEKSGQAPSSSSEAAPLGMKKTAAQQGTSNQISTSAVDTRLEPEELLDNTANQEQGNLGTLQETGEHGMQTHDVQGGINTNISSSYREGINPPEFHHMKEQLTSSQRPRPRPISDEASVSSSGNRHNEEATHETSSQFSESAVDSRSTHEGSNPLKFHYMKEQLTSNHKSRPRPSSDEVSTSSLSNRPNEETPHEISNQFSESAVYSRPTHEESNPLNFHYMKEQLASNHRPRPRPSFDEASASSSSNRSNEEAPHEISNKFSESAVDGRPTQEGAFPNNNGFYKESSGQTRNQSEANKEILPAFYHQERRLPSMIGPQKEGLANMQGVHSFEVPSLSSEAGRVASVNSNQTTSNVQRETSVHVMMSPNGVGTVLTNKDTSVHQHQETSQNSVEHVDQISYTPSDEKSTATENRPSDQREFEVGVPEQASEMSAEDQPKGAYKNQQQTDSSSARVSEGISHDHQNESDRDNKNQKIVYFLKMAKGIPLLNKRPVDDQHRKYKEAHGSGYQSTNDGIITEENKNNSVGEMISEDITKQYRWRWRPRPRPRRPRPSYRPRRPRPSPNPYPGPLPSPSPSPASGGGGGALGGSSVDPNAPQGKHSNLKASL